MLDLVTGNVPATPGHREPSCAPSTEADELVLVDDRDRAILLKGDGATPEESVAMAERARLLLGGIR
jgi:hypothetical protein